MNNNLTEILLIIDRSGSMSTTKADAEGGLNTFVEEQKKGVGQANLTLVQFDHDYEVVHAGIPLSEVPPYKLVPRGSTALFDAIGRAVVETGERLAKMPESERPGLVLVLVVTDGGENASREYTRERVKEMITHQESKFSWKFSFLGSNQDGFAEGQSLGFSSSATYTGDNTAEVYAASSSKFLRMRGVSAMGLAPSNDYTSEELRSLVEPNSPA